ncbi:MAG: hypothetical protein ISN29_02590 [Gammaproteobacteria bacterium AqS3]|nr:hypothetical protein [Gammaproteobacteria bacterium AqS3]
MPYIQEQKPRVTIIPKARANVMEKGYIIDYFVTGWSEPAHTLKSNITQEPLENGALVTDHVVALPVELEMKGYVSDIIDGGAAPGRAWERMRELHNKKAILNVVTEWGYYEDMVIKTAETKQEGRGMEFTVVFQQILRVGIDINEIVNPTNKRTTATTTPVLLNIAGNDLLTPNPIGNTIESSGQELDEDTKTMNFVFYPTAPADAPPGDSSNP